jgi:hypothetical protein
VIGILEFKTFLAGTGYSTGKNTRAGTGMGKILYPRVYMGNLTGRIFFYGYGYGMLLPDGYVPVAIPTQEYLQGLLGLRFFLQKEYPSEARIIIHSNKTIVTPADAYVSDQAE